MLFRASTDSNEELIDLLLQENTISSERVAGWMKKVDRANFCPTEPYVDSPQPIGCQQTISAPHMHALCLQLLENHLKPGARVLDVGSGSGYFCAVVGKIVGETGRVVGIDIYQDLVTLAQRNIRKECPSLLDDGIVRIQLGDGWAGEPSEAPFDAIHVGAGASTLPKALVQQLRPGGRLIIPIGPEFRGQTLKCIDKDEAGHVSAHDITLCSYVPLQKRHHA